MESLVRGFMLSELIDRQVIPIWNPAPMVIPGARKRARSIEVGDVGTFDRNGGFQVEFNILHDQAGNKVFGLDVPHGYTPHPFAEGGSIDLEMCLPPETMCALESDKEFMEAAGYHPIS